MDPYKVLGVNKSSSDEDIKKAFRKMSLKHHPDRPGGNADLFKDVKEASEILLNPIKRNQYDTMGKIDDTMEQMNSRQVRAVHIHKTVSASTLYNGGEVTVDYVRMKTCNGCAGLGGKNQSICGSCKGKGMIVINGVIRIPCNACGGQCYVIDINDKCNVCYGNKVVEDKLTHTLNIEPRSYPKNRRHIIPEVGHQLQNSGDLVIDIVCDENNDIKIDSNGDIHFKTPVSIGNLLIGKTVSFDYIDNKTYKFDLKRPLTCQSQHLIFKRMGMMEDANLIVELIPQFPMNFCTSFKDIQNTVTKIDENAIAIPFFQIMNVTNVKKETTREAQNVNSCPVQ
jgi:DnaJ-class molecular chaperone